MLAQVRHLLTTPEVIMRTWHAARRQDIRVSEGEVRAALMTLDPLWDELFPAEQARIVQLLVARLDVGDGGIDISLRMEGLTTVLQELRALQGDRKDAA